MSVPTSINTGLGGGGSATATGAAVLPNTGAPSWIPLMLVGFTLIFAGLLVFRLGKRGKNRFGTGAVLGVVLLLGLGGTAIVASSHASSPAVAAPVVSSKHVKNDEPRKLVALSFDDGPSPELTPTILRVLRENNVKATFFMQGSAVYKYPELVKRIQREGHTIGNHSFEHPDFSELNYEQAYNSIRRTNNLIQSVTGEKPVLFRYPYGNSNAETDRAVRDLGMYDVLWHWSQPGTGDFECPGWKSVEQYAINQLGDQAIILLHDGNDTIGCGEKQTKYLDKLIRSIRKRGYDLGTVEIADGPSPINQYSWVKVVPAS